MQAVAVDMVAPQVALVELAVEARAVVLPQMLLLVLLTQAAAQAAHIPLATPAQQAVPAS